VIGHLLNSTMYVHRRTVTRDALGGITESFALVASVDSRIQPLTAKETDLYSKEGETITHKAYFSFGANVEPRDRLIFRGKTFIVRTVMNPDYEDVYLVANVSEQD